MSKKKRRPNLGKNYQQRAEHLRSLGFATYREYLASDLWQRVREKVFAEKGRRCLLCGAFATQVHHNRYHRNDLTGAKLRYVNPICGPCHDRIEFDGDEKNTLQDAKFKFGQARTAWVNEQQARMRPAQFRPYV